MGTWGLWIAFNAGVALLLLLDLGLFHRRAHAIALREAALESAIWVALSVAFGLWIFFSHGRGPGLEFFTGYLIEKSLSVDNVFLFLLIFQFFRVDPRYQHRLLFWGVLGALLMRGAMIGAGTLLIQRFSWILYLFGAFLLYAGLKLFGSKHSVHPEQNPVMRWVQKILPMTKTDAGQRLFARENGQWLATRLFLVVIVLETTDLVFAMDSIPAVFGVTRDPFLVYSSNVCAILGLRAFYFLLAGILPYFKFLDKALAVILVFIGGKMLAEPWVHISTGISLAVVGGIIGLAVIISIMAARAGERGGRHGVHHEQSQTPPLAVANHIQNLAASEPRQRMQAAESLFAEGRKRIMGWLDNLKEDVDLRNLLVRERFEQLQEDDIPEPKLTLGIAVIPETFGRIHAANGSPPLADAPSDQDAIEFELEFLAESLAHPRLDILTTKTPGAGGAIDRFLKKIGEGIQQIEIDVTDVDRATEILRTRFKIEPIYPATRAGANGTRVNFFLVATSDSKKVLVEFVEQPKSVT